MQTNTTQLMEKTTEELVQEGLSKSISYKEYRELVEILVEEGKSTGPTQTDDLVNYTKLNNKRMKRWDKLFKIDPETATILAKVDKKITWLVLTESWCGDAAPALPVMEKVTALNPNITFKVILRDENVPLMNNFLTNGGMSIPKLIAVDDTTGSVIGTWGPRSKKAAQLVEEHKAEHATILPEFKQELQMWYNKDKGNSILKELLVVLSLE